MSGDNVWLVGGMDGENGIDEWKDVVVLILNVSLCVFVYI